MVGGKYDVARRDLHSSPLPSKGDLLGTFMNITEVVSLKVCCLTFLRGKRQSFVLIVELPNSTNARIADKKKAYVVNLCIARRFLRGTPKDCCCLCDPFLKT